MPSLYVSDPKAYNSISVKFFYSIIAVIFLIILINLLLPREFDRQKVTDCEVNKVINKDNIYIVIYTYYFNGKWYKGSHSFILDTLSKSFFTSDWEKNLKVSFKEENPSHSSLILNQRR